MVNAWLDRFRPASSRRDVSFWRRPAARLAGWAWLTLMPLAALASPARAETYAAVGDQPTVLIDGVHYLDLQTFLGRYNLQDQWLEPQRKLRFSSPWTAIELEADSREITYNGRRLFLGEGTLLREGRLWIDRIDAEKLLAPLLRPATYAAQARPVRRIVIDAGHGGRDGGTGNTARKLQEKTFTLDVAERLRDLLAVQGFEVVMTRTDDSYLGLAERALVGKTARADLFVSVHFNAAGSAKVHGTETYICTPQHQRSTSSEKRDAADRTAEPGNTHDAWNAILGYEMHRALCAQLDSSDRGLKRARFAVLRLAECPAVLVEAAYLSNDREAQKIATAAYRAEIAQAIANGVIAYANLVRATPSS